jgi:hypothetical protein
MNIQEIINWTGRDYPEDSDFSDFFDWIKRVLVDKDYAIDYDYYDKYDRSLRAIIPKNYTVVCYIARRGNLLYARGTGNNKNDAFCDALKNLINNTNKRRRLKH